MVGYKLFISWDIPGTDETADAEYSGILHDTRSQCVREFMQAKKGLPEQYALYIQEVDYVR